MKFDSVSCLSSAITSQGKTEDVMGILSKMRSNISAFSQPLPASMTHSGEGNAEATFAKRVTRLERVSRQVSVEYAERRDSKERG